MSLAVTSGRAFRRRWLAAGAVVSLAIIGYLLCWVWRNYRGDPSPLHGVTVVVSGDTAGWIIPCGCTSNQSGGLLRRGAFVRALQQGGDVLVVDAGGAPGGTSVYERVKFEAIVRGELAMGLAAHNLGGPEAALGPDYLRGLAKDVPFLSANLKDAQGERIAEPVRIFSVGGGRLAVVGVLSRRYAAPEWQVDDPREAILQTIAAVKEPYDSLVVLAYLPEDELRQLAAGLPEADIIIGGPTGQSISPQRIGPTLLASATNKGKFLVQLKQGATEAEQRLAWTGEVVEMSPDFPDDPRQKDNWESYLQELARQDFSALQTGLAGVLPNTTPKDFRLAGKPSCLECHLADCKVWEESRHAHAWETLAERGSHVDPFCQQCHTAGYGLPGGFESAARSPERVAVQCESCHGPALGHSRRPVTKTPFAAADQCIRCHDRENSPKFEYAGFWQQIRHGNSVRTKNPRTSP